MDNINSKQLVSFLGSPFVDKSNEDPSFTENERVHLYNMAKNNKVGLFFLDQLKKCGDLSPLEEIYESDLERYIETYKTAVDLSLAIGNITDKFALFKFLKPFPNTPSDVDALLFLPNNEYIDTTNCLLDNGYFKIGSCPSQVVVYDLRGGTEKIDRRTVGGKQGGRYYIDLYNDVSASHVVYINQETLVDHRIEVVSEMGQIQTLDPVADLTVVLAHSIVPEQLFTLGDYYTALHYIYNMSYEDLNELVRLFQINHATNCGIYSLAVTGKIHEHTHGFIPDKLLYVLNGLGVDSVGSIVNIPANFSMPHRYSPSVIFRVLIERMKDKKGRKSVLKQSICMLNPRLMTWVVYNIILRRTRKTY